MKFINSSAKTFWRFLTKKLRLENDSKTVQRSALCRSRRELPNEYLLAKIGVDTAENELLEVIFNIIQYYSFVSLEVIGCAASFSEATWTHPGFSISRQRDFPLGSVSSR